MSDPSRRNRLDDAASPYLRQHADDPVNWQPWDDDSFAAARERDVPVFLSIGYSACHWCHVMQEESFQDDAIADLLNEHFVPVKVDREERPDVDAVYMQVCQLVRGGGGWPLSVFLTPAKEPFYVGTYFPPEATQTQQGFRQLLGDVTMAWNSEREDLLERAHKWMQATRGELESVPEQQSPPAGEGGLLQAADAITRNADREFGGFGTGQKFPQAARLRLLLRAFDRTGTDEYRRVAIQTLDAMADGGLQDHLAGGFHRYCVDRDWTVPHFEKMLYDNADLPLAYLDAYRLTGDERHAATVESTLDFLTAELQHPDGGFYSTLDARSDPPGDRSGVSVGEEGAFYVWTPEEIRHAISANLTDVAPAQSTPLAVDDLVALATARYGVDAAGNFEGATVLTLTTGIMDLAATFDTDPETIEERLAVVDDCLLAARAGRPRPRRDEKILAGWNGLAIAAFAEAGLAIDDTYTTTAVAALTFVRDTHWDADGQRLSRRYMDGDVGITGYLEDYAFLAKGALATFEATGDVEHLAFAVDLARVVVDEFYDPDRGTLYTTPESGEALTARPQELADRSTPSSVGVACEVLLALDAFLPTEGFATVADAVLSTHATTVSERPGQHATLAMAADTLDVGHLEVTLAGTIPEAWQSTLGHTFLPSRLLAARPGREDDLAGWLDRLGVDTAPAIWANRGARDGPTAFVCRRECSPPVSDVDELREWLETLRPTAE
jgi:hypothetical protein